MCNENGSSSSVGVAAKQATHAPEPMHASPVDTMSPGSRSASCLLVTFDCRFCFYSRKFYRKLSGDVKKILESGQIQDQHLQLLENLGSGQCGTVYR